MKTLARATTAAFVLASLVGCVAQQPSADTEPTVAQAPLESACPAPWFDPETGVLVARGSKRYRKLFLMARKERPGERVAPLARIVEAREVGDELVFDLLGPAIEPNTGALVRKVRDLRVHRFFNFFDGGTDWAAVWVDHPALQNVRVTTEQDPTRGDACYELLIPQD